MFHAYSVVDSGVTDKKVFHSSTFKKFTTLFFGRKREKKKKKLSFRLGEQALDFFACFCLKG